MTDQKFISPCFIGYKKQEIKGLKLGEYDNLYSCRKNPVKAWLLGKDSKIMLSRITRQKNGIIYIPWAELSNGLKFKVTHGYGLSYYYEIYKIVSIEEYNCKCIITRYDRQTRASYTAPIESEVYADRVPF